MATRTMTKQQWQRRQMASATDPAAAFAVAYNWLRAGVTALPKRRHPDPAVRADHLALASALATEAADYLSARARELDKMARLPARQLGMRRGLVSLLDGAASDRERVRFAADWFRWSAMQVSRRSRKYTVSREERDRCRPVRDEALADAAQFLAGLAERAEERD